MLRLAWLFLVLALLAASVNFVGIEGLPLEVARVVFFLFLVLAVVFFIGNFLRGAPPRDLA
jgi:uncharacterized membrane protein YtjA (UPF0391 family)